MGNADTKLQFRKAVIQLTTKTQPIDASDEPFWSQFWEEHITSIQDVFALIPAAEIRRLREESPSNLATLCYKAVEKLVQAADTGSSTQQESQIVLNCVRILTRIIPYNFEDPEWRGFFWSSLPANTETEDVEAEHIPLSHSLLLAICDLLFCPDFTVSPNKKSGPDKHEDIHSIDSCEYIWEAGVGFANSPPHIPALDNNRTELLKLVLTCFSETVYHTANENSNNPWIGFFTSGENRHALPLFTSLLNIVCGYNPAGLGVPYNHLIFSDTTEPLVEVALQILITTLDLEITTSNLECDESVPENLFVNYLSRIHREEDFSFVLHGFTRLLNNPLLQTYLPHSTKKINFHQELLVFFWKFCDYNKKFMFYVLKSSDVLDMLVPILYHLNDSRADHSRVGLMHIGVFILLLLSGERNFGVRLNKPYTASVPMDIPVFTGTHADLLIIVFHKIITTGHQRLQPLFDCLLTILVNVSPYIKTMSMVSANKLLYLLEAFSTPWFLFSAPHHHHLVFFLLEIFNNIIQYQFDGNSNLVYTIIRKRQVFHSLANLPTNFGSISKSLSKRGKTFLLSNSSSKKESSGTSMEGSHPAQSAQPGTKTATLLAMPEIENITEKESAHPTVQQLSELTANGELIAPFSPVSVKAPPLEGSPCNSASTLKNQYSCDNTSDVVLGSMNIQPAVENQSSTDTDSEKCTRKGTITGAEKLLFASTNDDSDDELLRNHSPLPSSPLGDLQKPLSPKINCATQKWFPSPSWALSWKNKLPLQTIMRLLQVLVPQVEKICIDKGLTDESEILKFLQHGTLVGLLPVPHPILIRKYQANSGTAAWFRTYMWGIIYLRNVDPPIWYDTDVKLFEIQRV